MRDEPNLQRVGPSFNRPLRQWFLAAYVDYNNSGDEMEFESVEAFRAIARAF
jgi:hypothetical protein